MPRLLAPGVMKTIKPDFDYDETFTDGEIVEVTSLGAEFDWAKIRFPTQKYVKDYPVSCLEFQFKIPRIIEVDLPTKEGKIVKTPVWYMIYSVTNKPWAEEDVTKIVSLQADLRSSTDLSQLDSSMEFGSTLFVEETEPDSGCFNFIAGESTIAFTPRFLFVSESLPFPKPKQYVVSEQVIPLAIPAIIQREDPNRSFENTVSMSDRSIEPCETVWGVAMWQDIDPDVKDFSIYISGLSSAYRWNVNKEIHEPGIIGSGYSMSRKTLKLNFWAPGSSDHLLNKEIQYGSRKTVIYNDDQHFQTQWQAISRQLRELGTQLDTDAQYHTKWKTIAEMLSDFASKRYMDDKYRTKSIALVEQLQSLAFQLETDDQFRSQWYPIGRSLDRLKQDLCPPVDFEWIYR